MSFWGGWHRGWERWRGRLLSWGMVLVMTGHVLLFLFQHRHESQAETAGRQEAPLWERIFRSGRERGC